VLPLDTRKAHPELEMRDMRKLKINVSKIIITKAAIINQKAQHDMIADALH